MQWQKCPVCDGRGTVLQYDHPRPYVVGSAAVDLCASTIVRCPTCNGGGIILEPTKEDYDNWVKRQQYGQL